MGVAAFDTYTAAKRLRAAGFSENQAEAAVVMVHEAVTEGATDTAGLEAGLAELRTDVAGLEARVGRIEARVERIEATMATKEDVLKASKESSRDLLRAALALGAIMVMGFGAMLALLASVLPFPGL